MQAGCGVLKDTLFCFSAIIAVALQGCAHLGNVYSAQYEIACPRMSEGELRAEIRSYADRISQIAGLPTQVVIDQKNSLILNIRVPNSQPSSFWRGSQPVGVRMSYSRDEMAPRLFIAVHKENDPGEDETVRKMRNTVETVVQSSKCQIARSWLYRFDPV